MTRQQLVILCLSCAVTLLCTLLSVFAVRAARRKRVKKQRLLHKARYQKHERTAKAAEAYARELLALIEAQQKAKNIDAPFIDAHVVIVGTRKKIRYFADFERGRYQYLPDEDIGLITELIADAVKQRIEAAFPPQTPAPKASKRNEKREKRDYETDRVVIQPHHQENYHYCQLNYRIRNPHYRQRKPLI